ncbi:MAG: bifunctional methylenetetrahydrofolate dehydrogenase/methenyltetrahydrofolate cyclohydrolase FolD [Erysipelotrichaceae bacterium]
MSEIIYGNEVAKLMKENIKQEIDSMKQKGLRVPCLVVVLVGDHSASMSYIKGKEKACNFVGMENRLVCLDEAISEKELIEVIHNLNKDCSVDGILLQFPLPKHINEAHVLQAIDPNKDVDGVHPSNIGKMMMQIDTFLPCTPYGIMVLLKSIGYDDLSGKSAVVIGRSNIVGKPIAQLLLNKNATVTMTHSRTKDIEAICREADILVVAIGKAKFIKKQSVKEGAVVIDVGVNMDENNKLCGDVDFDDVIDKVSYITPVPKGVGPMTITMLLENTMKAYNQNMDRLGEGYEHTRI